MTLTTAERAAQMSLADKIKLFSELAPLIVMVQQIAVASDERQPTTTRRSNCSKASSGQTKELRCSLGCSRSSGASNT